MLITQRSFSRTLFRASKAHFSKKLGPMQKIIMLCGAPGVGKGTYARLLADDFGYVKVSTGDEIRKVLTGRCNTSQMNPQIVSRIKKYVDAGKLVPDDLVMEILYYKINEPSAARGIILDGFPRNINQLNMFTEVLPIHLVINIEHSVEYLMASLLGRRTCLDCGMSYSAYSYYKDGYELDVQMPEKEGECDNCSGSVVTRDDDREEIVLARIKEYEAKTYPLIEKMQERGMVINFEAKRGIRDYPKLQQIIVSRVGLPYYYFNYNNPDYKLVLSQD